MLALAQGLTDVAVTITVASAAIVIVAGADRFPPTRYILDLIDPARAYARHPSAGPPRSTGLVRRIPLVDIDPPAPPAAPHVFDFDIHA